MGNTYHVPPIKPFRASLANANELRNSFGLSPGETDHLNAFFHQYAGKDRRLSYRKFFKMYLHLNPNLTDEQLNQRSLLAFLQIDTNRDGQISFDEFVDSYVNNLAAKGYFAGRVPIL